MHSRIFSLFKVGPIVALALMLSAGAAYAHHSFAPYDIRKPIDVTGVAEKFVYRRPHPMLTLVDDKGVSWTIEVPIRRWERAGLEPDLIEAGDELVVRVFPARDGSPDAAMSGFTKEGTYYVVTEQVRQRSGNEAADAIERGEALEDVLERYEAPPEDGAAADAPNEAATETPDNESAEAHESTAATIENTTAAGDSAFPVPLTAGVVGLVVALLAFVTWKRR